MKNITDYFSTPDKENPGKEIVRKSKSPNISHVENINKKKKKSVRKRSSPNLTTNHCSLFSIVSVEEKQHQLEISDLNKMCSNIDVLSKPCTSSSSSSNSSLVLNISEDVSDRKNAFHVMMESRSKVIGSNSPGKECNDAINSIFEEKIKLSVRKKLLSDWAKLKGGAKRKRLDEEIDQIIKFKLEERSKRMKKMLNSKVNFDESSNESVDMKMTSKKKRKKVARISCSSNSSFDFSDHSTEVTSSNKTKKLRTQTMNIKKSKKEGKDKTLVKKQKVHKKQIFYDESANHRINISDTENSNSHILELNGNFNKENGKTLLEKCKKNEIIDIISNESSQEGFNTPPALRSWQMRIKLNLNEDKIYKEDLKELKLNNFEDENSNNNEDQDMATTPIEAKKLAPVFVKAVPKPKIDPEVLKARQEFLLSGTPSLLKMKYNKQQSFGEKPYDVFPSISHVQQKCDNPFWNLPKHDLSIRKQSPFRSSIMPCHDLINATKGKKNITLRQTEEVENVTLVLNEIKNQNPDYPVYKSFRLIHEKSGKNLLQEKQHKISEKKKRGRSRKSGNTYKELSEVGNGGTDLGKYVVWTEKYKPKSSEDIIGNADAIQKLITWLESWKCFSQEIISPKCRRSSSGSDFETTDYDSRDSARLPDNTIILGGPCGSGKSVAVYAISNQLGFNIIEVNASSKRTGKKLLQDLQEATQSYQVRKGEKGIKNVLNSNKKKNSRDSQNSMSDKQMCVLLVEDVDIVFDQDEGFIIALQQLIATSKRPIIITTTDYSSNFAQKFLFEYKCISFSPLQSSLLATWCQILCLIEGKYVNRDDIANLIDYNKGDMRRTLLQLQYWVQSGGQLTHEKNPVKIEHEEEIRSEKFVDDEQPQTLKRQGNGNDNSPIHQDYFQIFEYHDPFFIPFYLNLGFLWWNIPNVFGMTNFSKVRRNKLKLDYALLDMKEKHPNKNTVKDAEKMKLRHISKFYDSLTFADMMFRKINYADGFEPEIKSHTSSFKDSLELEEKIVDHQDLEFMHELTHTLVNGHVKLFKFHGVNEIKLNVGVPEKSETRWRAKHHVCEDSFRESLSPWAYVERKSVVLDYYPILRNISRSETRRAANNTKRGNRFRNYLRDLGIKCSENNVKLACNILWEKD